MDILVLNAGSSTLKFAVFDGDICELVTGVIDWRGGDREALLACHFGDRRPPLQARRQLADYADAVHWVLATLAELKLADRIGAVGHRVVHGGTVYRDSVEITDTFQADLKSLIHLAPLHLPPVIATLTAAHELFPFVTHVAVFDTAFYADLPESQVVYPVPFRWYEEFGVRRFGFHGISHAYCAGRVHQLLPPSDDGPLKLVICHLGSGCSATAVAGQRAVATTMGYTPLEGLMMGTRCGSIDPGLLISLARLQNLSVQQLEHDLNRESGLLGVSGVSSDYRAVEQAAAAGHDRAQLAIEMFVDRVRSAIGSLTVTLGGIDALVFTAGIGERSVAARLRICERLECLGIELDESLNQHAAPDCIVSSTRSSARILVLKTEEERMIALEVKRISKI